MNTDAQDMSSSDSEQARDAIWGQRCGVLHKAWVQLRYQRRRQRFFDLVDKITKSLTVMLGASMLGSELKQYLPLVASAISVLGLLALVFGYGDRKQLHKELAEQAATLIAAIEKVPAGKLSYAQTAEWNSDYARLCAKAPPPLKTLTILCEREQSLADGQKPMVKEPWFYQRWVSDFM